MSFDKIIKGHIDQEIYRQTRNMRSELKQDTLTYADRAVQLAIDRVADQLTGSDKKKQWKPDPKRNVGATWSEYEEDQLFEEYKNFLHKMGVFHGRTGNAIKLRLERMCREGKFSCLF